MIFCRSVSVFRRCTITLEPEMLYMGSCKWAGLMSFMCSDARCRSNGGTAGGHFVPGTASMAPPLPPTASAGSDIRASCRRARLGTWTTPVERRNGDAGARSGAGVPARIGDAAAGHVSPMSSSPVSMSESVCRIPIIERGSIGNKVGRLRGGMVRG